MKPKILPFPLPFLGYETSRLDGVPLDFLLDSRGLPIVGVEVENLCLPYGEDPLKYEAQHEAMKRVLGILGEGMMVQKLDVFSREEWESDALAKTSFLGKKYEEHFAGRLRQKVHSYLFFAFGNEEKVLKQSSSGLEEKQQILGEKVQKILLSLKSFGLEPKVFEKKDFDRLIRSMLSMNFSSLPFWQNLRTSAEGIKLGERNVKVLSLVDTEKMELPKEVEASSELTLQSTLKLSAAAKDNFSFLHELSDSSVVVYHQVIHIPRQKPRLQYLEKKKKRHDGVSSSNPSNALIANEIDDFLVSVAVEGTLVVDAHFSLLLCAPGQKEMEKAESFVETKLFSKGIVISKNAYNQLELFRSALPGNASSLKSYDYFVSSSEAALCFFFSERKPKDEESDFFLQFTDRQGTPLKIDLADLPMETGRISNRNKFVLGPSGSGKSFLMNSIVEQYLRYNYDIVIVDTGDSYKSLCRFFGGKYIQYSEEKPITMNPFLLKREELNLEKLEFLTRMIYLIWQGGKKTISSTEKSVLDAALKSYYEHFFEDENRFETLETSAVSSYLKDLGEEIKRPKNQKPKPLEKTRSFKEKTYYDVLGISSKSSFEEIRHSTKVLISKYHPDAAPNVFSLSDKPESYLAQEQRREKDLDLLSEVLEAYETLSVPEKREAYDGKVFFPAPREEKEVSYLDENPLFSELDSLEELRPLLLLQAKKIHRSLKVKELSFNSFYEFCVLFLPRFLKAQKKELSKEDAVRYEMSKQDFDLGAFFMVLKEFYRGGSYEKVLNEIVDESFFNEPFIVFEIDSIKDHEKLFPLITLIIMDTFIQKMRYRKGRRKALIIEEAWKAIASEHMAGYILYLYKTVRKFYGEAIVVTQELDDVISSPVVKEAIINNSDTLVLLDQSKFQEQFDRIASLLSLNPLEQSKIFTLNRLENKEGRGKFKEFYLKRGSSGEVYGNEVSLEQYLAYTTEKPEKSAVEIYIDFYGSVQNAIEAFVQDLKQSKASLPAFVSEVNKLEKPYSLIQ